LKFFELDYVVLFGTKSLMEVKLGKPCLGIERITERLMKGLLEESFGVNAASNGGGTDPNRCKE
jgi:hypothetical protein